jgi:eukaryotic-like serine/threonine-protein kinase
MPGVDEPKSLGRYEIKGVLGKGAMGLVYDGHDPKLNRRVAIKTILTRALDEATVKQYSKRFQREVRAVARLNHPNIVQVYDFGNDGDLAYIVMEYIQGRELKEYFDAKEPFDLKTIFRLMTELLGALECAHEAGVIHRDVKPANVLLDGAPATGTSYLTDFGLSKHVASQSGLTRTGRWVGTIDYAAPEQLQAQDLDLRVDVYALGCVLFESLTGEVPFPKAREIQKMIAHIGEPPPAVSARRPAAEPFDAVIARALAKNPAERFESAGALGEAARAAAARCDEAPVAADDRPVPGRPRGGDAPTAA